MAGGEARGMVRRLAGAAIATGRASLIEAANIITRTGAFLAARPIGGIRGVGGRKNPVGSEERRKRREKEGKERKE
ncbi:hypothetical protein, partial [Brachyspira hyodysenteriae]|uniref:hypothetical protein n=1 Tax=Brachyspira hyodysenteriae TaxID=159 RepID=UPI0011982861